ncbi:MAG: phosphoribosylformylglycinamidine synthase II, partial [Opitutae bacterium]|nr:phosphoribosylformylglycinamidine synthase II [Opitutae bacterium]
AEKALQDLLISQIEENKITAAHDIAEGGLLVCLSEMLFNEAGLGATVSLADHGPSDRLDALLFGESQGRVIIAVKKDDVNAILDAAKEANLSAISLGSSNNSGKLKVEVAGSVVLDADVSGLKNAWERAIPDHMELA